MTTVISDEGRANKEWQKKSFETHAAAQRCNDFGVASHARTYINRCDEHGDWRDKAPYPGNVIKVIAGDLAADDARFGKLVHLLCQVNDGNHRQQDQHHEEKRAEQRFQDISIEDFQRCL